MTEEAVIDAVKAMLAAIYLDGRVSHRDDLETIDLSRGRPGGPRHVAIEVESTPRLADLATETVKWLGLTLYTRYGLEPQAKVRLAQDAGRIESRLRVLHTYDSSGDLFMARSEGTTERIDEGQGAGLYSVIAVEVMYRADVEVATNTARS